MKMKSKNKFIVPNSQFEEIQLQSYYRNHAFEPDDDFKIEKDEIDYIEKPNFNKNEIKTNVFDNFDLDYSLKAISFKNVYFKFNRKRDWVLNCLQMNVPCGSIYGLLGASGSGKTTLLKLSIGFLKPASGEIFIFDRKPTDENSYVPGPFLGYMPQEIALYPDMSIKEIITYFGFLYLMSKKEISKKLEEITCLLQFKNLNQKICCLSGGEKRRVSLATAIIHSPPLLILDEPTAGIDPLLRQNVWNYLTELVNQNQTTIIITTHYIEEARKANLVGFIRKGKLLAEKSPESLLIDYSCKTLEKVFLELCKKDKLKSPVDPIFLQIKQFVDNRSEEILQKQQLNESSTSNKNFIISSNDQSNLMKTKNSNASISYLNKQASNDVNCLKKFKINSPVNKQLNIIKPKLAWLMIFTTLLQKNFLRVCRNPALMIFQFFLPISQIVLFNLFIGADPFNIPLGIVNEENPPSLSAKFLENIDEYYIKKVNYSNLNDAIKDVRKLNIWGVLHIKENFSDTISERFLFNDSLSRSEIEKSKIYLYSDLTNKIISIIIERSLVDTFQKFSKQITELIGVKPGLVSLPIKLEKPIYGTYIHPEHKAYRDYCASGFIMNISFAMSYGITCVVLVLERLDSMFERHFIAGVTSSQIIFAHTIIRFIFTLAQTISVLILCVVFYKLPMYGSFLLSCILLAMVNVMGLTLGLVISAICKQVNTAAIIAVGLLFYIFFISGNAWPLEAYPTWLRYYSLLHPTTLPSQSLQNILLHGWSLTHPKVYPGFIIILLWIIIFLYLGIKNFKFVN